MMKTIDYRGSGVSKAPGQYSPLLIAILFFVLILPCITHAGELKPLPSMPIFPENPITAEKVELGKKLFFDRRLSGDGTMACATCHNPETGYTDGLAISLSYPTTRNWRNASSLI
jgi:cytochrome c peroxidase